MFDLARSSLFFEQLEAAHPTIEQNIELVHENKLALDAGYHQPKRFILALNNLIGSVIFFIESALKNSPPWLHEVVTQYLEAHQDDFQKLRHLRNVSAHHKLIVPDESLVLGLYRIRSSRDYLVKLGFGNESKPTQYSPDLAFKDTDEVFHDLLSFSSIAFMDLEHTSIGECLGITRKWFFKIHFKTKTKRYNEVVDVYALASDFSMALLDVVCKAYAVSRNIQFQYTFTLAVKENNFINTLLELDLYPSLFTEWWDGEHDPINFGVRSALSEGKVYEGKDQFHKWMYDNLTPTPTEYKETLRRVSELSADDLLSNENLGLFTSFILVNHWHYKKAFGGGLHTGPVTAPDVMKLQRAGRILLQEFRKEKFCTIQSSKKKLDDHIQELIERIDQASDPVTQAP